MNETWFHKNIGKLFKIDMYISDSESDKESVSSYHDEVVCDFEDGDTQSMSGAEWYKVIYESNSGWALSSNGTIFRSDIKAVVPGLLERWYAETRA